MSSLEDVLLFQLDGLYIMAVIIAALIHTHAHSELLNGKKTQWNIIMIMND